jgi:hypothetical protein
MTARKPAARKASAKPTPAVAEETPAVEETPALGPVVGEAGPEIALPPGADEQPGAAAPAELDEGQAPKLAWCRIGRDLEENAPECPRHEFEAGARLCNLHFVTRLDLREVARNDG